MLQTFVIEFRLDSVQCLFQLGLIFESGHVQSLIDQLSKLLWVAELVQLEPVRFWGFWLARFL